MKLTLPIRTINEIDNFRFTFVKKVIRESTFCQGEDRIDSSTVINTDLLNEIIENYFMNGMAMEAISCTINNTLRLVDAVNSNNNKHVTSEAVNTYIKNIKRVTVGGSGAIYNIAMYDNSFRLLIKAPKIDGWGIEQHIMDEIEREYVIGTKAMNNLRYYVPNFMYTYGMMTCPIPDSGIKLPMCESRYSGNDAPQLLVEYIQGRTFYSYLVKDEIDFDLFLNLYVQVLLALELAQRKYSFTHYDLHTNNVMIRKLDKPIEYTVCFDDKLYHIRTKYLAVIIDFGMACVKLDDNFIGDMGREGGASVYSYITAGADMVKLLYGITNAPLKNGDVRAQRLWDFFGDPNSTVLNRSDDQKFYNGMYYRLKDNLDYPLIRQEFASRVNDSVVGSKTPLMFVKWIFERYKSNLRPNIQQHNRIVWIPVQVSNMSSIYYRLIGKPDKGYRKAIETIQGCISNSASYLMTLYNIKLVKRYNFNVSKIIEQNNDLLKALQSDNIANKMIARDINMLNKYRALKPISEEVIQAFNLAPANYGLMVRNNTKTVLDVLPDFYRGVKEELENINQIKPYLTMCYIIQEIIPHDIDSRSPLRLYVNWCHEFRNSAVYKSYMNNVLLLERINRILTGLSAWYSMTKGKIKAIL